MKRILCLISLFLLSLGLCLAVPGKKEDKKDKKAKKEAAAPAPAPKAKRWIDTLTYPPQGEIKKPAVVRADLPNGMKVLLIEDHSLPRVDFSALIGGGKYTEPADRNYLSEMLGSVLRTGGTKAMTGDQMDEFLERIGASVESGGGESYFTVGGQALVEHLDKVLPVFADVIRQPAFAQDKIDLDKTQTKSGISRRNDDVNQIARREFQKLLYGADSPLARVVEYDHVDAIKQGDLFAMHQKCFRPDNTILAVWGDFSSEDMKGRIARLFGDWKAEGPAPKFAPPAIPETVKSVNYVEKKDVEQTFILFGLLGLRRDDPDYPAVSIMSDILGGGFSSRIFKKVRTEKGLAYGAGGTMIPAYDHKGSFFFYTSTKHASTALAISTVLDEIRLIRETPVTDEELRISKEGVMNSSAFDYDSMAKVINRLMVYEFYGYPSDYNEIYRKQVEAVTREDVLRVAKKYLNLDALVLLAVGRGAEFDKPLSTFGEVRTIDITIPEPKMGETLPEPTPETLAKGRDILVNVANGRGGQAILGIQDVSAEATMTADTPMGKLDLTVSVMAILPNRLRNQIKTPMGDMVMVLDGDTGWMTMGPQKADLPDSQASELKRALLTEYGCLLLLKHALEGKAEVQFVGKASFEGQEALLLVYWNGKKPIKIYASADGKQLLGSQTQAQTQEGPTEVTEIYGGYKDFGGITIPAETSQKAKGKVVASTKTSSFKVNTGIDPLVFKKPEK